MLAVGAFLLGAVYLWIIPQFEREQGAGPHLYSMSFDPFRLTVLLGAPPIALALLGVIARRFTGRDDQQKF